MKMRAIIVILGSIIAELYAIIFYIFIESDLLSFVIGTIIIVGVGSFMIYVVKYRPNAFRTASN